MSFLFGLLRMLATWLRPGPAPVPPRVEAVPEIGVTPALLRALGTADPDAWAAALAPACARFEINTKPRLAMFLANVIHESGGFRTLTESLNYSVVALVQNFGRHRISVEDARLLGRKPGQMGLSQGQQEALANVLYGGAWGRQHLGNTVPDDGWRYRGRGLIQITGRSNYAACGAAVNLPLTASPEMLLKPRHAAMSAAWFWAERGRCNPTADAGDVAEARRRVNGADRGLAEVMALYQRALAATG